MGWHGLQVPLSSKGQLRQRQRQFDPISAFHNFFFLLHYLVYHKAIHEALQFNLNYTQEDIEFTIPIVYKNIKNLINFLLHIYLYTIIGRFSLLYNEYVNRMIKNRNVNGLANLINIDVKHMFPELYMNNSLNNEQKQQIEQIYFKSFKALNDAIYQAVHNNQNLDKFNIFEVLDCSKLKIGPGLYQNCYKQICKDDKFSSINLPEVINVPLYFDNNIEIPIVQCINFLELIKLLSNDNINYNNTILSGININNLNNLKERFDAEIKMYQYYLRERNNMV